MQISMIRHGCTAGNLEHRYVGSTDEWLTMEAVQELSVNRGKYPQPELVFISPMRRCLQTAKILYPTQKMVVLDDLRECEFGEFEYRNYKELQGDGRYQAWIDSGGTIGFPGGESRAEFITRCCRALETAYERAVSEDCTSIGFVVHGGTIMAVLDQLSQPHGDYFDWQVKNARGFTGVLSAAGEDSAEAPEGTKNVEQSRNQNKRMLQITQIRKIEPEI